MVSRLPSAGAKHIRPSLDRLDLAVEHHGETEGKICIVRKAFSICGYIALTPTRSGVRDPKPFQKSRQKSPAVE